MSSASASILMPFPFSDCRDQCRARSFTLVARGYVDQQTGDSATGPIADYVLGAGLAIGAAGWSVFRARLMHARWVQAWIAPAKPLPAA